MLQLLLSILTHAAALALYPGLLTMVAVGSLIELAWMLLSRREREWPELPRRRLTPVVATVAVCAVVAAVQLAAPFNPPPGDDLLGVLRFFGITLVVAAVVVAFAVFLRARGAAVARAFFMRGVASYAAVVLAIVVATSILMR